MGRAFLPVLSAAQLYFTFLQCTIIYKAHLPFFVTARFSPLQLGTEASVLHLPQHHHYITEEVLVKLATAFSGKPFITGPAACWHPTRRHHPQLDQEKLLRPPSATQPCAVVSSDQLQAIEAVQPTPPCRGAIQGLLPSVLGVS